MTLKPERAAFDAASAILEPLGFTLTREGHGKHTLMVATRAGERYQTPAGSNSNDKMAAAFARQWARRIVAGKQPAAPKNVDHRHGCKRKRFFYPPDAGTLGGPAQ